MGGAYFASLLRRYIYLSVASSPYSSGVDAMSSSPPPPILLLLSHPLSLIPLLSLPLTPHS